MPHRSGSRRSRAADRKFGRSLDWPRLPIQPRHPRLTYRSSTSPLRTSRPARGPNPRGITGSCTPAGQIPGSHDGRLFPHATPHTRLSSSSPSHLEELNMTRVSNHSHNDFPSRHLARGPAAGDVLPKGSAHRGAAGGLAAWTAVPTWSSNRIRLQIDETMVTGVSSAVLGSEDTTEATPEGASVLRR